MVQSASWLAPLLIATAGVFLGLRWVRASSRSARAAWREQKRRANARVDRDWTELSQPAPTDDPERSAGAFVREPVCEDVHAGKATRSVIWADLTIDAPSDHDAINQIVPVLQNQIDRHMTPRVVVRMSGDMPSSRRFWMALREVGYRCAVAGGVLVVRLPESSLAWNEPQLHGSPWYLVAPRGSSRSECLALAATADLPVPEAPPERDP